MIGVEIASVDRSAALERIAVQTALPQGGYVCFCNVHTAVMARRDPGYRNILNNAFLCVADGKPICWAGRLGGDKEVQQVAGPDLFEDCFAASGRLGLKHYLYGGRPEVLAALVQRLQQRYPEAALVGWESPPFRPLTANEEQETLARIRKAGPDLIWVGLGAPKQELWMARHAECLQPAVLLGVGAAFDFHAGAVPRAPLWMRHVGLEWLHRLVQEPRRLFFRYAVTNSLFLWYLLVDFVGRRRR